MRISKFTYLSASLITLSIFAESSHAVKGLNDFKKYPPILRKYNIFASLKEEKSKNQIKIFNNFKEKKDFSTFIKIKNTSKNKRNANIIQKEHFSTAHKKIKIPAFKDKAFPHAKAFRSLALQHPQSHITEFTIDNVPYRGLQRMMYTQGHIKEEIKIQPPSLKTIEDTLDERQKAMGIYQADTVEERIEILKKLDLSKGRQPLSQETSHLQFIEHMEQNCCNTLKSLGEQHDKEESSSLSNKFYAFSNNLFEYLKLSRKIITEQQGNLQDDFDFMEDFKHAAWKVNRSMREILLSNAIISNEQLDDLILVHNKFLLIERKDIGALYK